MTTGRVFAVAGAKGGVGKTTTSINLGAGLAEEGVDVVVVEADLAMANVVDFLSLNVGADLHEVLCGDATVREATCSTGAGFDVLPSGTALDGFVESEVTGLTTVVATLRERYDAVVFDTGAGLSYETVLPLALADATILVSSPRVAAVRDTQKTAELVDRVDGHLLGTVFARSGTGSSPPVETIVEFLETDLLGHVPADEAVPASQDAGRPVVTDAPGSDAAEAYREVARTVNATLTDVVPEPTLSPPAVARRARAETRRHRDEVVSGRYRRTGAGPSFEEHVEPTGPESKAEGVKRRLDTGTNRPRASSERRALTTEGTRTAPDSAGEADAPPESELETTSGAASQDEAGFEDTTADTEFEDDSGGDETGAFEFGVDLETDDADVTGADDADVTEADGGQVPFGARRDDVDEPASRWPAPVTDGGTDSADQY